MGIESGQMVQQQLLSPRSIMVIYLIAAVKHVWFTKAKCAHGLKVFINTLTPWLPQLLFEQPFLPGKRRKNHEITKKYSQKTHNTSIDQSN